MLKAKPAKSHWPHRSEQVKRTSLMALATFWAAAVGWAMMNGPRLHAEAQNQTAMQIEAENRSICQRLGMPSGSDRYSACAGELNGVRQRHEDRVAGRSAGFL